MVVKKKTHEEWLVIYERQKNKISDLQSRVWTLQSSISRYRDDYNQKCLENATIRSLLENVNKLLELKIKEASK